MAQATCHGKEAEQGAESTVLGSSEATPGQDAQAPMAASPWFASRKAVPSSAPPSKPSARKVGSDLLTVMGKGTAQRGAASQEFWPREHPRDSARLCGPAGPEAGGHGKGQCPISRTPASARGRGL